MPKKKSKVPVQSLPPIIEWMIRNATGQQLTYASQISRGSNFKVLISLFENFKHYSVYQVFRADVRDNNELALIRASARGRTSAFDAFLMFCEVAQKEITRRKKDGGAKKK